MTAPFALGDVALSQHQLKSTPTIVRGTEILTATDATIGNSLERDIANELAKLRPPASRPLLGDSNRTVDPRSQLQRARQVSGKLGCWKALQKRRIG